MGKDNGALVKIWCCKCQFIAGEGLSSSYYDHCCLGQSFSMHFLLLFCFIVLFSLLIASMWAVGSPLGAGPKDIWVLSHVCAPLPSVLRSSMTWPLFPGVLWNASSDSVYWYISCFPVKRWLSLRGVTGCFTQFLFGCDISVYWFHWWPKSLGWCENFLWLLKQRTMIASAVNSIHLSPCGMGVRV